MVSVKVKLALFIVASYVIFFSSPAWSGERFTVSDDCVTDNLTGLIWAKNPDNAPRTWQEALEYANDVDLCGFNDWRLPHINELADLANAEDGEMVSWPESRDFINGLTEFYWSAISDDSTGSALDTVGIKKASDDETFSRYVWPVRFADEVVPCSYTLSLTSDTIQVSGGTGLINITTSSSDCSWTAKSNVKWLKVLSGKTGVGDGTIQYSILRNKSISQRGGTLTIAGQTFTVTQDGIKQYTLTVAGTGKGSGTIKSSPSRISCGLKCSKLFNEGTTITLTARPSSGSTFEGWSGGGCSGTKTTCTITDIAVSVSITAAFGSPDLSGSFSPAITAALDSNKYKFTGSLYITNNGDGKASDVRVALYLSSDGSAYYKKDLLGSMKAGSVITAGATQFLDLSILGTDADPKGKYIIAVIDPALKVKESNENNNITVSSAIQAIQ